MKHPSVFLPVIALVMVILCISFIVPPVHASRLNDAIKAGDEAFKAEEMPAALEEYQKALDLDPNSTTAWYRLGLVLLWTGSNEEAISAFERAQEINPVYHREDLLNNKGYALFRLGRFQDALAAFDAAIATNPDRIDSGVHNNRGLALLALGNQNEAMRAFDRAINVNSYAYESWNNEGVLLAEKGDYSEALKRFSKIRERGSMTSGSDIWWKKPTFFLFNQGNVYLIQGNFSDAIETFNLVIQDNPDAYDAYVGLGHAYLGAGNLTGAREAARLSEQYWPLVAPEYQNVSLTGHFTYYAKVYFDILTDEQEYSTTTHRIEVRALPVREIRLKGTDELLAAVQAAIPAEIPQTSPPTLPFSQPVTPAPTRAPLSLLAIGGALGSAGWLFRRRTINRECQVLKDR